MKNTLFTLSFLLSFNTFAQDMSRTENSKDAYKTLANGDEVYVGGCSTHQDYEKKKFTVTKTLVPSFVPGYETTREEIVKKLSKKIEIELVEAAEAIASSDGIHGVDDFSADKIAHKTIKGLDLYRLDIGVGGGNGMVIVFNRSVIKGKPIYDLVSYIFDGDIEFCDSKVWTKK